jgi:hypothetical protein
MADFFTGTPVTAPGGNSNSWSDNVSQNSSSSSGSSFSTNNLPGWYTDYWKNLTGAATNVVQGAAGQPVPHQQQAGFNPDQLASFQGVRDAMGKWQPALTHAATAGAGAVPTATGYVNNAVNAVAGPSRDWPQEFAKYMSPFTASVVDEIGRLGARNFAENVAPAVDSSFIGAGHFGSTRNAEIMGRAARDSAADTLGKQNMALESGYKTAADIFGNDADRTQRQQSLQAQTNLAAGKTLGDLMLQDSANAGNLAKLYQQLALGDATAAGAIGATQQQQAQGALDLLYKNAMADRNAPMDLLTWAKSIIAGAAAPQESGSSQSSSSSGQSVSSSDSSTVQAGTTNYTPSGLAQVAAALGIYSGEDLTKALGGKKTGG